MMKLPLPAIAATDIKPTICILSCLKCYVENLVVDVWFFQHEEPHVMMIMLLMMMLQNDWAVCYVCVQLETNQGEGSL